MCLGSYIVVEELETDEKKAIKDCKGGGVSPIAPSPFTQGPPRIKLLGNSALSQSPGLPVLLLLTCVASSPGSYAAGLAHCLSVQSCLPPFLAPCLLQPRQRMAARGMWPLGQLVSSKWQWVFFSPIFLFLCLFVC